LKASCNTDFSLWKKPAHWGLYWKTGAVGESKGSSVTHIAAIYLCEHWCTTSIHLHKKAAELAVVGRARLQSIGFRAPQGVNICGTTQELNIAGWWFSIQGL
jgi:hypothetical protein